MRVGASSWLLLRHEIIEVSTQSVPVAIPTLPSRAGRPGTDRKAGFVCMQRKPAIERFMSKIQVGGNGCWMWTGYKRSTGYGQFNRGPGIGTQDAHRYSYEYFIDPDIPTGMDVHHVCEHPPCVNPEHLCAVTRREHIALSPNMRSYAAVALGRCPQGHEYVEGSYKVSKEGWRGCLICQLEYRRKKYRTSEKRKSIHRGVYWKPMRQHWEAQLRVSGRAIFIGAFHKEVEAAHAYNEAVIKHFGDKAKLNPL